ncbi:hypothetical protein XELAEV_18033678mg [Xenopus laevis]|uniref:Cadherin domain-containing protein n=1 Tax=Xenopus laevis TaxID=8355 RepID=A0A974CLA5_XENLA|nr:hypothetical protein XELAEV_18033678mg [Xenopus laevis]
MFTNLSLYLKVNEGKDEKGQIKWNSIQLNRQKREWLAPVVHLREEEDNRHRNPIAKVHSDKAIKKQITYLVSGPGVNQEPFNIFLIDGKTGYLNVTGIKVDREVTPVFFLTVRALSGGADVEKPLSLRIRVIDINDNAPVFSQAVFIGAIAELSSASSLVMQIIGTDADEENTLHSKIAYKIISQNPSNPVMFIMNKHTGEVFTVSGSLDREEISSYSLVVSGADMDGAAGALSGECSASINILDVNDNIPSLEYESFSISVDENMLQQGLLFIQVNDRDEMYTDNWVAEFEIVSGNEGGWFVIETDAVNNRGVLHVVRELNYEAMQMMNLGFVVRNRAPFHSSIISQYQAKVTNIAVHVQNVNEGFAVIPRPLVVNIPAGLSREQLLNYILVKLQMENLDTGEIITNAVFTTDENSSKWLFIDEQGNVRLIGDLPRDTAGNGNFTANILGTDNSDPNRPNIVSTILTVDATKPTCPVITSQSRTVCSRSPQVVLQADDGVGFVTSPFTFSLVSSSDNSFTLTKVNDTSAMLTTQNINNRNVTVDVQVTNINGESCAQPVRIQLQVCDCLGNGDTCTQVGTFQMGTRVALGPAAIGLLIMGFLALLLVPLLLLLCSCGSAANNTFIPVADGYDGGYRPWGTEGAKPEDVDVTNLLVSSGAPESYDLSSHNYISGGGGGLESTTAATTAAAGDFGTSRVHSRSFGTGLGAATAMGTGAGIIGTGLGIHGFSRDSNAAGSVTGAMSSHYRDGGTVNTTFVENYFAEKAEAYANEDESRPANDCLLIYDNEGVGSPTGSIGCCSFIDDDLDDSYLDNLGPKFKTLAEICSGKKPDPVPSAREPKIVTSIPRVEPDSFSLPSTPIPSSTYVSESFSSSNLPPAKPISEPRDYVVTETYTTSGPAMNPSVYAFDPIVQPNILVTERMLGSTSGVRGAFPEITDRSNVIVTERVMRPASGVHDIVDFANIQDSSNVLRERMRAPSSSRNAGSFNFPDLSDSQNVVVTERMIHPISNAQGNLDMHSNFMDGQNVLVTERLIQPVSNVSSGRNIHPDLVGGQNVIVTEKTVRSAQGSQSHVLRPESLLTVGSTSPGVTRSRVTKYSTVQSGPGVQSHVLSPDPLLTQTVGSTSPGVTRSRVTKYSTVQYSQ